MSNLTKVQKLSVIFSTAVDLIIAEKQLPIYFNNNEEFEEARHKLILAFINTWYKVNCESEKHGRKKPSGDAWDVAVMITYMSIDEIIKTKNGLR